MTEAEKKVDGFDEDKNTDLYIKDLLNQ